MENEEDLNLELDIEDEENQEETQEKPRETIEAKKARLERQLSQINKKLGNDSPKTSDKVETQKGDLDRIDKAILRAEKITDSDEIALARDIKKETGKDIEDVLESRYFKAELKAMREEKQAQDALPSSSKRTSTSSMKSVEYWIAKGEMPPASEPSLRTAYVNAKMANTKRANMFSDNPIS